MLRFNSKRILKRLKPLLCLLDKKSEIFFVEYDCDDIVRGCFIILKQVPMLKIPDWIFRQPHRSVLKTPKQLSSAPEGKTALTDLLNFTVSALESMPKGDFVIGPLEQTLRLTGKVDADDRADTNCREEGVMDDADRGLCDAEGESDD